MRSEWMNPGLARILLGWVRIASAEVSVDVSTVIFTYLRILPSRYCL